MYQLLHLPLLRVSLHILDGTFKLMSVTNSALNMQCNVSLEYHLNVTFFFVDLLRL